jgi:hypothetical protein
MPKPGMFQHCHVIPHHGNYQNHGNMVNPQSCRKLRSIHHRSRMSPPRDGNITGGIACNTNMEKTRGQITRQLLVVIHLRTTGFLDSANLKANKGGDHGGIAFGNTMLEVRN